MALSNSDHGSSLYDHASVHRATGSLIEGPPTGGAWDNIESAGGIPKPLSPGSQNVENSGYASNSGVDYANPSGRHGQSAGTQRGNSPWFRRG